MICTAFSNGKSHDFRLYKESKNHIHPKIKVLVDSGYQGLQKIHKNTAIPKKSMKKRKLSIDEKKKNQKIAKEKVVNENVIGMLKRFRIIYDKYRNRRKRFGLRFNLIAAIYNMEL